MKVWVDADACPLAIKAIIVKAAIKRKIFTVFVANKFIALRPSIYLSRVQVEQGPDIADQHISECAKEGDIVITQDIPLAANLVPKKVIVISIHGVLLTMANIGERLSIRDFMQDMRDGGFQTKGPRPFDQKDKQHFAQTFDQQITKAYKATRI